MPQQIASMEKTSYRKARNLALQALYELDCTDHLPEDVVQMRIEDSGINIKTAHFLTSLVSGVLERTSTLDNIIMIHAPEWPVDQLAVIDRNLLRLAIYELTIGKQMSVSATVNEYIEMAKQFGGDTTPRFINGVLGTVTESIGE